ncbi:MAG: gamma-glutamyl-gamma-aminobutyrate hydrolase family protein [Gulosibacter sp.]|uniref:gamma-glutamyl-gamma-aminobutyrate hydrolase family protein n=1 Tax=Gulosibacter sp. TaxID=2817531 RepID=UPI003F92DE46
MNDKPLIGVPAMSSAKITGLRYSGSVVANAVLEAIARAGGEPVIISPVVGSDIWGQLDGIVLPGGSDINPARYGEEADESYAGTDFAGQDDADSRAIAAAEELGLPTLLICRGMQLWNVERGGTMIQHWPSEPQQHVDTIHEVDVEADSRLAQALAPVQDGAGGGAVSVSSYHHQAVGRLGRGLRVVARGPDDCVEALEDPEHNIVAVQWHPEDRAATLPVDQALFDWVVREASQFKTQQLARI